MINVYSILLNDIIINIEKQVEQIDSFEQVFSIGERILTILIELLVAVAGVYGIRYFYKLKVKNYNATFGYYSRLKVRLHKLLTILNKEYKDYILDRFVQEEYRPDVNLEQAGNIKYDIIELATDAKETLAFLKKEDDQMPASEDWNKHIDVLLDFLEDCERIQDDKFFKWQSDFKAQKDTYYELHNSNLKTMLDCIDEQQAVLQEKIYRKPLFSRIMSLFNKKKHQKAN